LNDNSLKGRFLTVFYSFPAGQVGMFEYLNICITESLPCLEIAPFYYICGALKKKYYQI